MPDADSFDALHEANPRYDPAFDSAVAAIAGHTKETLTLAGFGAAGAVAGGGPPRRVTRHLLSVVIGGAGLLGAIALVTTVIPSPSRSHQPSGALLKGPTTTPVAPVAPVPTTAPPVIAVAPPVSNPPVTSTPAAPTAPPNRPGSTPSAAALTASRKSTAANSVPAAAIGVVRASAVPMCAVAALVAGPPAYQTVRVTDSGSGLASISNIAVVNGTVNVPHFSPGARSVVVVATKTDQAQRTVWSFDATDVAGRTTHCV